MKKAVKGFLRRIGAMHTTVVGNKEVDQPRVPFRQIAQYEGMPVIYPDGTPCYDLPDGAKLHLRGSLKVGENLQAAWVYEGKMPPGQRVDAVRGKWPSW
jgi:hypothetical protein